MIKRLTRALTSREHAARTDILDMGERLGSPSTNIWK